MSHLVAIKPFDNPAEVQVKGSGRAKNQDILRQGLPKRDMLENRSKGTQNESEGIVIHFICMEPLRKDPTVGQVLSGFAI